MVYGDGLENRCSREGTVGSNPTPSAIVKLMIRVNSVSADWDDYQR